MTDINAIVGWACIAGGVVSGAVTGLFFHDDAWLGGYASFRRRMVRLGHIAFFGIGILNLLYALTVRALVWPAPPPACAWALAAAGLFMPLNCYLAAWRKPLRHLFFVPVSCVLAGVLGFLVKGVLS